MIPIRGRELQQRPPAVKITDFLSSHEGEEAQTSSKRLVRIRLADNIAEDKATP